MAPKYVEPKAGMKGSKVGKKAEDENMTSWMKSPSDEGGVLWEASV